MEELERSAAISKALHAVGLFHDNQIARESLAQKLSRADILLTKEMLRSLLEYASGPCKARNHKGMVCSWLQAGGWEERLLAAMKHEIAEVDLLKKHGGDLKMVSDSNPYGWYHPDRFRQDDHAKPGEWNSFRQAYNLTLEEQSAGNLPDCRVRGCTRYEVVGKGARPDDKWNPEDVKTSLVYEERKHEAPRA